MIFFSYMPFTGKVQTGLVCSFLPLDDGTTKLTVSQGSIVFADSSEFGISEDKELILPMPRGVIADFNVMLVKKLIDQSVDIVVTYYSETSRSCVFIVNEGYELISLLGNGTIKLPYTVPDLIEFKQYIWV
jgi:hypothetical protein